MNVQINKSRDLLLIMIIMPISSEDRELESQCIIQGS